MKQTCEECDTQDDVVFCTGCNDYFCQEHWSARRVHRDGKLGPGGMPHEKVLPEVNEKVELCMAEPVNASHEEKQHQEDDDATWFGLDRDAGGDPVLAEYRRYAAIMMDSAQASGQTRYPALVSFIGQTGAGKSALIRLLIDPTTNSTSDPESAIAAPVVGRSDSTVPTSADVHLYVDPETASSDRPLLFADCEGFQGGERDPVATNAVPPERKKTFEAPGSAPGMGYNPFQKLARGTKRALLWARKDSPNHEKTSKRGYAISQMYPRIFYAFSDVVVFVLTNPRTLEVVVEHLLDWAHANYSKATNLPCNPHAIIALNKSEHLTADDQWDSVAATANLLRATSAQINQNSTFKKHVEAWKTNLFRIRSMEDLLHRYYSTVHVVRLPHKSRSGRMNEQRSELYRVIKWCCNDSLEVKRDRKMLADVDELGLYLSFAFDHFSKSLDEPFDYVEASLKHQPPPATLLDNLKEFTMIMAEYRGLLNQKDGPKALFTELTPIVASCMMLDSARKQRIGQAEDWFGHTTVETPFMGPKARSPWEQNSTGSYKGLCRAVIEWYLDSFVPCEFPFRDPSTNRRLQCIQTRKAHGWVHRARYLLGTEERYGEFISSFDADDFSWETKILDEMKSLQRYQWHDPDHPRETRVHAHCQTLLRFYENVATSGFFSNSICLTCLSNAPEHPLHCGHILCRECALDFGRLDGKRQIVIEKCPLHDYTTPITPMISRPTVIPTDPPFSALRVLILDGGGIRGIVELCVLEALENRLGIPLQYFFDLVVGTSTGGIVALGFGHQRWNIADCITTFEKLVRQAFTLRRGQGLQGYRHLQIFVKKSRYETKPLTSALQTAFTPGACLFGQALSDGQPRPLKVAVTATSSSGSQSYVLSNYNTENTSALRSSRSGHSLPYMRYRPSQPEREMKVWEAARSTSAAPGYFKPYRNKLIASLPELMDGGILHNNPVELALEEARRIAETAQQSPDPDILLSIGTGLPKESPPYGNFSNFASMRFQQRTHWIRSLFTLIAYQIKLNLDAQRRWRQVFNENDALKPRMHRLNPDLGAEPPPMDDVDQVIPLRNNVRGLMTNLAQQSEIDEIACILVASSFYFERNGNAAVRSAGSIELPGHIKLRPVGKPDDIYALGKFLSACNSPVSVVVENLPPDAEEQRTILPVAGMLKLRQFEALAISIRIPGDDTTTSLTLDLAGLCKNRRRFQLSGFPRVMMRQDFGPGRH